MRPMICSHTGSDVEQLDFSESHTVVLPTPQIGLGWKLGRKRGKTSQNDLLRVFPPIVAIIYQSIIAPMLFNNGYDLHGFASGSTQKL